MGKHAARARLECGDGAKEHNVGTGRGRDFTPHRSSRFKIDCATCGYSYETQMLKATCPGCSGRVLIVTDLSRLSHDGR